MVREGLGHYISNMKQDLDLAKKRVSFLLRESREYRGLKIVVR